MSSRPIHADGHSCKGPTRRKIAEAGGAEGRGTAGTAVIALVGNMRRLLADLAITLTAAYFGIAIALIVFALLH